MPAKSVIDAAIKCINNAQELDDHIKPWVVRAIKAYAKHTRPKNPPQTPHKPGQRVSKTGRPGKGVILHIRGSIADTAWDDGGGPFICRLTDLKVLE